MTFDFLENLKILNKSAVAESFFCLVADCLEAYLGSSQTSMMGFFAKIVQEFLVQSYFRRKAP